MSGKGPCSIQDCPNTLHSGGLCKTHDSRRRLGKDLHSPVRHRSKPGEHSPWSKPRCKCDECRRHRNAQKKNWLASRGPDAVRANNLLYGHGISLDEYAQMFEDQQGRCASCRGEETQVSRNGTPHMMPVDHDHETGEVRGLLCHRCNRALGLLGDDPGTVQRLLIYIRRFK